MKRIAGIVAAVLLSALALFALLVALVPRDALKARIGEQIASWTGREVSLRGEPEIGVFPRLSVTLSDVHVAGPQGMEDAEILSMDRLTGTVRLLPLLIGRIEIGSFEMVRPLVRLVRDSEGRRNWDFDSGAAALQLAFEGDVPLGDFSLEGGTLLYEDRQGGETERLDSVNLAIDWPSVRNPIAIDGAGIWRGEQVTLAADANSPFGFLSGGATPVEVRIESAPLSMLFSGQAEDYPMPKLDGALKLSTPSLRRFAGWLGSPIGPGSTLGQASGFGTAEFRDGGLEVENAEFTLDGNGASGALKIAILPKLDITGTLAFQSLDLTPYFTGLDAVMATSPDWRKVKLTTDWFRDINADIRLSADSVRLGELIAGDAAASASLRDGRLEIGLARAVFGDGSLAGDLAITDSAGADGAAVEAQLHASDIALHLPPTALGLPGAVSGNASLLLDVGTGGADLGSLLSALTGTARLTVKDGAVPLFGLAEIATAAPGALADSLPAEGLSASTVESASLGLNFSGGLGMIEVGNVITPGYSADVQGWVGLLDGSLGLNGAIRSGAQATTPVVAGNEPLPEPLRFTIEGTLSQPVARSLAMAN